MKETQFEVLNKTLASFVSGTYGPSGLEALAIALAGPNLSVPVSEALQSVASSLDGIAMAIDALTKVVDAR